MIGSKEEPLQLKCSMILQAVNKKVVRIPIKKPSNYDT